MRISFSKKTMLCGLLYIGLILSVVTIPTIVTFLYSLLFIGIVTVLNYNSILASDEDANSFFVALPIILSSFQNVYLGFGADRLNSVTLQVLLSISIAIITITVFLGIILNRFKSKEFSWLVLSILVIIIQSVILLIFFPTTLPAYLSSMRNILAPLLIFYFSIYGFKNINLQKFYKYMFIIILVVLIFGFIEYIYGNSLWTRLNIKKLWALKGLAIENRVVPGNWHSSELIGGKQLRRMVSTFADPVNLGSYLFAAFMLAWYKNKKLLQVLLLASFVLSVSKAAFLSMLVYIIIYTWVMDKNKILSIFGIIISTVLGLYFYNFSQVSSYGSINAHIDGFFSALSTPLHYPFGMGVGSVGVLASKLGSQTALSSEVLETGIGMIIAQLGFVGVIIYLIFFVKLSVIGKNINNKRDKILWFTLIYSFLANAFFNEVALSPNSCTLYFLILGLLYNKNKIRSTEFS
ncbi:TPA: polymerase [Streptococcus pneumoniae]|nr:polymerase [Streptococcus pneumoniae]